jgi:hypothetical protein
VRCRNNFKTNVVRRASSTPQAAPARRISSPLKKSSPRASRFGSIGWQTSSVHFRIKAPTVPKFRAAPAGGAVWRALPEHGLEFRVFCNVSEEFGPSRRTNAANFLTNRHRPYAFESTYSDPLPHGVRCPGKDTRNRTGDRHVQARNRNGRRLGSRRRHQAYPTRLRPRVRPVMLHGFGKSVRSRTSWKVGKGCGDVKDCFYIRARRAKCSHRFGMPCLYLVWPGSPGHQYFTSFSTKIGDALELRYSAHAASHSLHIFWRSVYRRMATRRTIRCFGLRSIDRLAQSQPRQPLASALARISAAFTVVGYPHGRFMG